MKNIIIIILVLVLVGGAIWFLSTLTPEEPTLPEEEIAEEAELPEEIEDETADWQAPESQEEKEIALDTNCDLFPTKLDSCTKYKCQFIHPFTGETMTKEILGIIDGKCNYIEEMPSGGKMECKYPESERMTVAQYYKDLATAESFGTDLNVGLLSGDYEATYTINGKVVDNPLQEALDSGICIITGY